MSKLRNRGIFCLEGPWSPKITERASMRPLLEVVEGVYKPGIAFRDAATSEEVNQYLKQWSGKQYASHPYGIMSFHGESGKIKLLGKKTLSLRELGDVLAGKCHGRLIHFDSCSVMDVPPKEMKEFRLTTKAAAVSGFTQEVDWLDSAAFTLMLLNSLVHGRRISEALREMYSLHYGAARSLGFRAGWARGQVGIPGRH